MGYSQDWGPVAQGQSLYSQGLSPVAQDQGLDWILFRVTRKVEAGFRKIRGHLRKVGRFIRKVSLGSCKIHDLLGQKTSCPGARGFMYSY